MDRAEARSHGAGPRRSESLPAARRPAGGRAATYQQTRRVGAALRAGDQRRAVGKRRRMVQPGPGIGRAQRPGGRAQRLWPRACARPDRPARAVRRAADLADGLRRRKEVDAARARIRAGLGRLERELVPAVRAEGLTETQVLDGLRWVNFFLAYQGRDDRDLQRRYAAVAAAAVDAVAPQWRAPLAARSLRDKRVRVGFASAFFHTGTCGRYFKRWITDLDRERFELFVYHLWPGIDDIAQAIAAAGRSLPHLCRQPLATFDGCARNSRRRSRRAGLHRARDGCHHLWAGGARLAPRQYAAWGHPVTTGHATIDAFFSCAAMERADAPAHYTERLVLLPGIGTRYERPTCPRPAAARNSAARRPYAAALPAVAVEDPPRQRPPVRGDTGGESARAAGIFRRLASGADRPLHAAAQVDARCVRHSDPRADAGPAAVGHDDYLRINMLCDAMIDTLHWSGGNSSLDALACSLPVVTLPGAFMRGRQSAGMLSLLGVPELIAADAGEYLSITARLAGDEAWRRELGGAYRHGAIAPVRRVRRDRAAAAAAAGRRYFFSLTVFESAERESRPRSSAARLRNPAYSAPCRITGA